MFYGSSSIPFLITSKPSVVHFIRHHLLQIQFGLIGLCSAQLIKQPHQGIPCNSKLIISRRVLGKLTSTRWASTHRCRFMYTCAVPHNRCMRLLPFSKRSFPISKPWMHFHSMHYRNSAEVFLRPSTLSNTMRQRPSEA